MAFLTSSRAVYLDDLEREMRDVGALAPRALRKRSCLSSYVLAVAEPLLLLIVGVGLVAVMLAGSTEGLGSKAPAIEADSAPTEQARVTVPDVQTPPQPALATAAQPDQRVDVFAATNPAPPGARIILAVATMPALAAGVSLSEPPEQAAENTASRAATLSVKPNDALMSKGMLEAAPLPPTRPKTLASSEPGALAHAKPSDAKVNADDASSFSIELASSHSKSDALAILSRLKKQFPDMLGGGSIHRTDGGGTGGHYRVQAGPLSRQAANKACSRLRASGENCIVVGG